ncbi:MAG: HEAT repeat domain-containing protein [Spirochaetaceae bacterium]|jgi:HEAT repeat protein|nr:HEAT repeat domain-containing protein [Spirochaetaceae bacterium]
MIKFLSLLVFFLFTALVFAEDESAERDVLRYGTDNEISELIKSLKKDNSSYLDDALVSLLKSTKNSVIKSQVISFFAERGKEGVEDEALSLIEKREDAEPAAVLAAIDYIGKVKYSGAQKTLRQLLEDDDERWKNPALRAIGAAAGKSKADSADTAKFLIEYYKTKSPPEDTMREIITALGEAGSDAATDFLTEIITGNETSVLTVAAIGAAAKIGDKAALSTIIGALSAKEPNVRAAAVEALGDFEGADVNEAVLDAFRDSYWRTRLAAIKSAGKRKLAAAVPYLKFRAEKDEAATVREEAVRSLGAIGNKAAADALEELFDGKRVSDKVKTTAALMLIQTDAGAYAEKIIAAFDEARRLGQKQFATGLLTALGKAKTEKVRTFTGRLFASKDAVDKAFALELCALNGFSNYRPEVQRLTSEQNSGLSRKARETLQKL